MAANAAVLIRNPRGFWNGNILRGSLPGFSDQIPILCKVFTQGFNPAFS
jgi:hypothetical protein